ncbi:MAG: ABC transporter permease [Thaumarchaeota archaeon]|nr:ABC transporter permease [Nitrososphaerota archaeon]
MTFRVAPLVAGLASIALGLGVIALFAPTDFFFGYAQVTAGGLSTAIGLYLIFIVSWRELDDNDPRTPRLYSLVRREVRGRALRTVASGTAIAVLVGVLLSTLLLTNGAAYSVSSTKDKLGADLLVVPVETTLSAQPFYTLSYAGNTVTNSGITSYSIPRYLEGSITQQIASVPGVKEATPQLLVTYFFPAGGCGGLNVVYIVGVATTNNFLLKSYLPTNASESLSGNGAVSGAEVPGFYQLPTLGLFYGVQLDPRATLPRTGTFMDHIIFVSMDTANAMLRWQLAGNDPTKAQMQPLTFHEGQVSAVFVKLDDGASSTAVAAAVGSRAPSVKAYTLDSIAKATALQFSGLLSIFSVSGTLVWVGSLTLVATLASLATSERKGEIGVMRTLGGSRSFIRKMVATQTMLTTSIAGLVAIIAVWIAFNSPIVYDAIMLAFKIPYIPPSASLTLSYVLVAAAIVLVTSGVGALLAARVSGQMDAYEAIRKGSR